MPVDEFRLWGLLLLEEARERKKALDKLEQIGRTRRVNKGRGKVRH